MKTIKIKRNQVEDVKKFMDALNETEAQLMKALGGIKIIKKEKIRFEIED